MSIRPETIAKEAKHHKMTGWFEPRQLLHTAVKVVVSALLGTRSDFRLMESFGAKQRIVDYSAQPEIWVDYVADLGDGWDSTYAVARAIAERSLTISTKDSSHRITMQQGQVLVMGGDEVYPTPDRTAYKEKLFAPYACAFSEANSPGPDVFAIPGNHDWYDGLVAFTRLFCQDRKIGALQSKQRRSYFALQLPARWWIWGVDIQLESDIDLPQRDYFAEVATRMNEGDRVILVTAEPDWIYGNIYDPKLQTNLAVLEEEIIGKLAGATVRVTVAGDLHHYRRHEATDQTQKQLITSGGGGAFLHPTFGPGVDTITVGAERDQIYKLRTEYPDQDTSKLLLFRNLLFLLWNPQFGLLTGFLYLIIAWIYWIPASDELSKVSSAASTGELIRAFVKALLISPFGFLWIILIIGSFWMFTDTHKKLYRYAAGTTHALFHILGIVISGCAASVIANRLRLPDGSISKMLVIALFIWLAGYVIGSEIMGVYLYISLRLFRRHSNEAFSALHIGDYKNFLRLHIDQAGRLTIYPIGIDRVPSSKARPATIEEISPHLIESPVIVS